MLTIFSVSCYTIFSTDNFLSNFFDRVEKDAMLYEDVLSGGSRTSQYLWFFVVGILKPKQYQVISAAVSITKEL